MFIPSIWKKPRPFPSHLSSANYTVGRATKCKLFIAFVNVVWRIYTRIGRVRPFPRALPPSLPPPLLAANTPVCTRFELFVAVSPISLSLSLHTRISHNSSDEFFIRPYNKFPWKSRHGNRPVPGLAKNLANLSPRGLADTR